jgi:hypothetical protein
MGEALSSRSHLPLSSGRKERYRCLLQKSTRLPGFFELQRHFIRSSLPEIPSRPFRTIHRGEGMTDGGLCCLGLTALCPLDERRDYRCLLQKSTRLPGFFELQRHFIRSSLPEIPSRPFRTIHRGEGMTDGGLYPPHPHPVHRGEGMTDRGLCCLGLTALCPLDERRDIAACYRKAPDCQVFFEHQRWFIRSSLTEIPSRPFRTIHCGEGMTDGGLCPPDSAPLCHLDVKRDIAACYGKAPDCQVFFEHQRRFIRSSLTEIPSWPFRTIHCGEGMTDRGLCPPHPHLVHCGEGMTDGGGFVLPIPPAVVLWTKGEISLLATEKHPTARFFRTSKALHPVIAARDSFSAIPHDPPRRRNDGWGALLPGSHRPLSSGRKERYRCLLQKSTRLPGFFELQRHFIRSSLPEIPSRPFRTIHRGEGMTEGGLCCLGLTALCPLDERRDYRCLLQKSTRLPGFFELQRHFIRSSLAEIPSRPFRTIHRGEGMTDGGLYPPHPHPVHRGEGMTDGGLCCLGLTALCPLDERRDYRCLLQKSTRLPGFFELQRHFIRSSLPEIPSRPFRTIHRGEGMTDGGLYPPHPHPVHRGEGMTDRGLCCLGLTALCPLDERRDIAACYRKAPDCQVFSNFKGASSGHRWRRFLLGHSARSTAAKE